MKPWELKDEKGLIGTIEVPVEELKAALGLESASAEAKLAETARLEEAEARATRAETDVAHLKEALKQGPSEEAMTAYLSDVITEETWRDIGLAKGYLEKLPDASPGDVALGEPKDGTPADKPLTIGDLFRGKVASG